MELSISIAGRLVDTGCRLPYRLKSSHEKLVQSFVIMTLYILTANPNGLGLYGKPAGAGAGIPPGAGVGIPPGAGVGIPPGAGA